MENHVLLSVGDKCWYVEDGRPRTGKILSAATEDDHFYRIEPTWGKEYLNGRPLLAYYRDVFPRPEAVHDVIERMKDYMRSIKYDIEELSGNVECASEVDTISTGFVDVRSEGSGEGYARCGKCRHGFEWSVYTTEGLTWDDERGIHMLECPECAKTAPVKEIV